MFCINPFGRRIDHPSFVPFSFSSTLPCHDGNDLSYCPAPNAEFSTTCRTPFSTHASIALLPNSTSCGIGEHTRYSTSTPSSAFRRLALSAKSAITVPLPAPDFLASPSFRYIALTGLPVFRTSCKTAPPTIPEAPVIRIINFPFLLFRQQRPAQYTLRPQLLASKPNFPGMGMKGMVWSAHRITPPTIPGVPTFL